MSFADHLERWPAPSRAADPTIWHAQDFWIAAWDQRGVEFGELVRGGDVGDQGLGAEVDDDLGGAEAESDHEPHRHRWVAGGEAQDDETAGPGEVGSPAPSLGACPVEDGPDGQRHHEPGSDPGRRDECGLAGGRACGQDDQWQGQP
jgi:hypothetical protein